MNENPKLLYQIALTKINGVGDITARQLLAEKKVDVVIGYGETETGVVEVVFIRDQNDVNKLVWNKRCLANLAVWFKRKEAQKLGRPAIVVKGCDSR